jgi:hypothetical protein
MGAEAEVVVAPDAVAGFVPAVVVGRDTLNILLKGGKSDMIVG